jgi:nitroreductase
MNSPGFAFSSPRHLDAGRRVGGRTGPDLPGILGQPRMELLRLASMAPSGHNAQPWLVLVRDARHWSLAIAPDRRLPAVDPADREAALGLGAFLENLSVAGEALGCRIEVERYGQRVDDPDLVTLRNEPASPRGDTLAIRQRRTTRRPFDTRPVARRDIVALCDELGVVSWIAAGSKAAAAVREIVVGATRAQAARDDAQAELASWLHWPEDDERAPGIGLTPESLEMGSVSGWLARHLPKRRLVMSKAFRKGQVDRAAALAEACGGWLVLASPDSSIPSLLETGRRLERLFLRARSLGLAVHPVSQPLQEPGWRQDLERATGIDGFPRALLRIGYADLPERDPGPRIAPGRFTHLLC